VELSQRRGNMIDGEPSAVNTGPAEFYGCAISEVRRVGRAGSCGILGPVGLDRERGNPL